MVVVHSPDQTVSSPAFRQTIAAVALAAERRSADRPRSLRRSPGTTISADRHTAIVMGGAAADPNEMVRAADDLKDPLTSLGTADVQVAVTGASGMWSDFNDANRDAMMKSEMISWPVTLAILVLAFGSLVAAGLPLLLTILGLVASAGSLYLLTRDHADLDLGHELRPDVRARARHRLRAVHRLPLPRRPVRLARRIRSRPSRRRWTPPARRSCSAASPS